MIVTETGCIKHVVVQWDRIEDNYSIYKCLVCGEDVDRESEDCGSGC
jgi:hypothetical protein